MPTGHQAVTVEQVQGADGVGAPGRREGPGRARLEAQVPDGDIGFVPGRPRARRRLGCLVLAERAGDHHHLDPTPLGITVLRAGDVVCPEHGEVGLDELVGRREVEPDLEQLERVGAVTIEQGEHLGVHDPPAGGEPLHVTPAEPGRGPHGVGVVDDAGPHVGHGLEAPVGVAREPRHHPAVVHVPPVDAGEVLAEVAAIEGSGRAQFVGAGRVVVAVVGAEQEGVDRGPLHAQGDGLQHGIGHGIQPTEAHRPATRATSTPLA
jgi:hypothetical protein